MYIFFHFYRRHLCENFSLESRLKTYSEIVHEESLPTLFRTCGTIFTPPDLSRKLKPMRLSSVPRNMVLIYVFINFDYGMLLIILKF